jgi:hypothetical protein
MNGDGNFDETPDSRPPNEKPPKFTDLGTKSGASTDKAAGAALGGLLGSAGVPGAGAIGTGVGIVFSALGIGDKQFSDQQIAYMNQGGINGAPNPAHVMAVEGRDGSKVLRGPEGQDIRVGGTSGMSVAEYGAMMNTSPHTNGASGALSLRGGGTLGD